MVAKIVEIRKAREIDPAADVLKSCLANAKDDPATSPAAIERLGALLELIDLLNGWFDQMRRVPRSRLLPLIRLGSKAVDLLGPFIGARKPTGETEEDGRTR